MPCVLVAIVALLCARAAEAKNLKVVATVGDLGAIAREVLGGAGQVTVLAKPTQDPHFVDARPNLVLDLNRADALVVMGLEYEIGWLPVLVRGARNARIQPGAPGYVDASNLVEVRGVPAQRIDRSLGDIHPGGNPHFTLDPRNGARIARGLGARFGDLAPENRETYQRNAEELSRHIEARVADWERRLARYRGTPVITYHRSFIYLTGWLGLEETATIEPKPGIPPTAAHVAEVVATARRRKVPIVLQERWYPSITAELLARQTGARLVLILGMTPEGSSYIDHVDGIVRAIADGLDRRVPQTGGAAAP